MDGGLDYAHFKGVRGWDIFAFLNGCSSPFFSPNE